MVGPVFEASTEIEGAVEPREGPGYGEGGNEDVLTRPKSLWTFPAHP